MWNWDLSFFNYHHHPPYGSLTVPFSMPHLVSGISFRLLSDNLGLTTLTLMLLHLFLHLLPHPPPLTHHCHHPSLHRCFTPGSKPSSTNHFYPRLSSPFRTVHGFLPGTVSSEHIVRKTSVMRCWHGYVIWLLQGANDLHMCSIWCHCHTISASIKSRTVYTKIYPNILPFGELLCSLAACLTECNTTSMQPLHLTVWRLVFLYAKGGHGIAWFQTLLAGIHQTVT